MNIFKTMICLAFVCVAARAENPFVGRWALTIPSGGAGWLGVEEKNGELAASVLWGSGSVVPVTRTSCASNKLILIRVKKGKAKQSDGTEKPEVTTETITATLDGDAMRLVTVKAKEDGKEFGRAEFSGKRIPPLSPAPDLKTLKFGEAINLLNGKDLAGWKIMDEQAFNGWSAADGVLINRIGKDDNNGNLRTEREFEDFNLALEVRIMAGGNSGVYLRGLYEVQVADTFGKPLDSHNMGAVYSRITPSAAAEKHPGEWQTLDMTLIDRHITVILNGVKIIDNAPVLGCTGGALTSDELKPGPIYLQGDHTGVEYRNITLRPVIK